MANFEPKKLDLDDINGGIRFTESDGVTPNAINDPIEAVAYAQTVVEHLTDTPDTSEINNAGSPNVSFVSSTTTDGVTIYKFKFSNLSGATFTPSLDEAGNLSWSNNRNLPNPPTINISGRDYLFSSEVLSGNYIPQVNSEVTDMPLTSFNRAPVDDIDHCYLFYYYTPENIYYWLATQVVDIQETTATLKILSVVRLTGYTPTIGENGNWVINGEDTGKPSYGASGVTDVVAGASYNQDDFTVTPLTFNFEVGNSKTVNVKAAIGDVGDGTYAKLAQVVRVDTAQSLTDDQKTQAQNNMGLDNKYAKQNGTYPNLIAGSADEATKLATARNMQVNLASGNQQSFDGSADATGIGVKGILPEGNGGTGMTDLESVFVRTDKSQGLTLEEKQRALGNVGFPYKADYSTQKEWLRAAKISFSYAPSGGGYNIVFLVGESNSYTTFGLLQLSGTTVSLVGFGETFLRYINFNASSTQQFDPGYIKAVKVNNLELDLYIKQTSKNYTVVGLQVLSNFGAQKPDITVLLEAADDPGSGSNVTYASEPTVRANYISSDGSPVLVGSTPSWVTGTSGSITLPSSGWYYIRYNFTSVLSADYTTAVFYWTSGRQLLLPISYYNELKLQRSVSVSFGGVITVYDPTTGSTVDGGNVSYYKLA